MSTKRDVNRLVSVFDLKVHRALRLPRSISSRVVLSYDKRENKKEFKVLNRDISEKTNKMITSWLEENFDIHAITPSLGLEEIDVDDLAIASNS
jgi:predicted type IV restriction endonuclease